MSSSWTTRWPEDSVDECLSRLLQTRSQTFAESSGYRTLTQAGGLASAATAGDIVGMREPEHSKIIARAAKQALAPLGFWRRGHSRIWLADHGYWLGVVEFQPSGFAKGSYLNVAAHWLWRPPEYSLSFDYFHPDQTRPFIEFFDAAQFTPLARDLAKQAARDSERLVQQFDSLSSIASALIKEELASPPDRAAGWSAFHAAVAAGLAGNILTSRRLFQQLIEQTVTHDWERRLQATCADLSKTLPKPCAFRDAVLTMVEQARSLNRLPPSPIRLDIGV